MKKLNDRWECYSKKTNRNSEDYGKIIRILRIKVKGESILIEHDVRESGYVNEKYDVIGKKNAKGNYETWQGELIYSKDFDIISYSKYAYNRAK